MLALLLHAAAAAVSVSNNGVLDANCFHFSFWTYWVIRFWRSISLKRRRRQFTAFITGNRHNHRHHHPGEFYYHFNFKAGSQNDGSVIQPVKIVRDLVRLMEDKSAYQRFVYKVSHACQTSMHWLMIYPLPEGVHDPKNIPFICYFSPRSRWFLRHFPFNEVIWYYNVSIKCRRVAQESRICILGLKCHKSRP